MDTATLQQFELFEGFTDDELERTAELFTEQHVRMGDHLIERDDYGYSFFLVLEGEVRVDVDGEEVARLGAGEHFGELALVRGVKRNARVVATNNSRLAKMMTWDFRAIVESHPALADRLEAKAAERERASAERRAGG